MCRAWHAANPDYASNWNAANKEKEKIKSAIRYQKNKEKRNTASEAWRKNNPEKYKEICKRCYEKTKEKRRAASLKWYHENKEKASAYRSEWQRKNKSKVFHSASKRRATLRKSAVGSADQIIKWDKAWRKKKTVTCYWCGLRVSGKLAHCDHIQPLSKGGSHEIGNLCVSCAHCNQSKHAKTIREWNSVLNSPVLL